jgi:hypothetical protein
MTCKCKEKTDDFKFIMEENWMEDPLPFDSIEDYNKKIKEKDYDRRMSDFHD